MRYVPVVLAVGLLAPPAWAAEPAGGERFYHAAKRLAAATREHEFVQMLTAVLKGSRMGPGDGWFKPSQSRYDWPWLAARFDADKNGKIVSKEFTGPPDLFLRLDRNRDGAIAADDFDWSDGALFVRQMGLAQQWFMLTDPNLDRRLTKAEWDALFQKVAQGKDYLNLEDVRALLNPTAPPRMPSFGDMPSKAVLLKGLFSGELGSPYEGPRLGAAAPDFTLKSPDGQQTVTLSKLVGPKPVVLVFGSFT